MRNKSGHSRVHFFRIFNYLNHIVVDYIRIISLFFSWGDTGMRVENGKAHLSGKSFKFREYNITFKYLLLTLAVQDMKPVHITYHHFRSIQ